LDVVIRYAPAQPTMNHVLLKPWADARGRTPLPPLEDFPTRSHCHVNPDGTMTTVQ
jgi:hypothetical protein